MSRKLKAFIDWYCTAPGVREDFLSREVVVASTSLQVAEAFWAHCDAGTRYESQKQRLPTSGDPHAVCVGTKWCGVVVVLSEVPSSNVRQNWMRSRPLLRCTDWLHLLPDSGRNGGRWQRGSIVSEHGLPMTYVEAQSLLPSLWLSHLATARVVAAMVLVLKFLTRRNM